MQNKAFPDALAIAVAAADVICKQLEEKPDSASVIKEIPYRKDIK